MDAAGKEKPYVGQKVIFARVGAKTLIGLVVQTRELSYLIMWEDGKFVTLWYDLPAEGIVLLTEQQARGFFPDRYEDWVTLPADSVLRQYGYLHSTDPVPWWVVWAVVCFMLLIALLVLIVVHLKPR